MSSFESRIAELKDRANGIAEQIITLAQRRKERSLDAAIGDKTAVQAIADLDVQSDSLKRESQTVSAAIELAEQKQREADAQAERKQLRQRAIEARKHSDAIQALHSEIDLMFKQLREVFERRNILLQGLVNTEICDRSVTMRLANKTGATAAAAHAGLSRYLGLELVPVVAQRPLADSNALLAGIGKPSEDG
jgi:hypothetical protein